MPSAATTDLLYIDSSSFLVLLLGQDRSARVETSVAAWEARDGTIVSSRLLWLEAERVAIREAVVFGNDIRAAVREHLRGIEQLPVTEDIWARATQIEQHIKTLDAIHLATCELAGATLLTAALDGVIATVAVQRGVPIV